FTSGTTSKPKGVVHSHQTLGFETRQLLENYPADRGRQLTGTPVGHFIGMLGAFLIPVLEGAPIDLCDVWDPGMVLKLIGRDGLSIGGGPPYFVTSVLDHPDCGPEHLKHFTTVGLGGSTVPAAVTRRLADLGMFVFRSYGSSEHPSITGSAPTAPEDKRLYTDGNPRPGVEIRLGPDGEIFLTITDRKADVIIRGGENISALEVEEVLLTIPSVVEAVVVAAPDERRGERAAAVLRVKAGHAMPTLDEVREHFKAAGVATQKWPEELHQVDDYPRTASGKVQKFRVRQSIQDGSAAAARKGIAACQN